MIEGNIYAAVHSHFKALCKKDAEHGIVEKVLDEIMNRMIDHDMPPQEIASILLPVDHPANMQS
jgi:hypothetical protein